MTGGVGALTTRVGRDATGPVLGPRVEGFERAVAERLGVRHVVAVASATAGYALVYRALGVATGARLLTGPTADPTVVRAALGLGMAPRFADVDGCGHLDAAAVERHVQLHGAPAVLVPSHVGGHPCDVDRIVAAAPGAFVVEDATDAIGAVGSDGRPVGSGGAAGASVVGVPVAVERRSAVGALVTTDDPVLAYRLLHLREERPEYRLSELHATLAMVQLGRLRAIVAARAARAAWYETVVAACPLATPVLSAAAPRSAWTTYGVRVPPWGRRAFLDVLRAHGVHGERHPVLLNRHPYLGRDADALPAELPAAARWAAELVILPTGGSAVAGCAPQTRSDSSEAHDVDRAAVAG